jgi:hypothetical protein
MEDVTFKIVQTGPKMWKGSFFIGTEEHLCGHFSKRELAYKQIANDLCIEVECLGAKIEKLEEGNGE